MVREDEGERMVAVEVLEEAKEEIEAALEKAYRALHTVGGITFERARSYWYAHVRMALDKNHDYLGGSMITMQDTIDELEADADEGDEDAEANHG